MRFPWIDGHEEGPLRKAALLPLDLLAGVYGAAARSHRWLYERGLWARRRLPCAVVSVGSLTVGGAGKTPGAAWLARELSERGVRVALASRGHGRSVREPVTLVSDGWRVLADLASAGDEALLLASHAPKVPVLIGADRGLAGLRAVSAFDAELLVLDDGFQHHRLARDLEIVLVDGAVGLGNRRVLPRGPLREVSSTLRRADAIGVVDGELGEPDERLLAEVAPEALRFSARRRPVGVRMLRGGPSFAPRTLEGMRIGMFSGVGSPAAFRRTLEGLGAEVVAERRFRDHHRYGARDLARLRQQAAVWLTTEKDALKLRPEWARGADVRVLRIDFEVAESRSLLDAVQAVVAERVQRDAPLLASQVREHCPA